MGHVQEEGALGVVGAEALQVGDRLVGDVVGEVVALRVGVDLDRRVVADEPVGVVEVRPALQDAVEAVEPPLHRPRAAIGTVVHGRVSGEVPLADRVGGVARRPEHLGQRGDVGADLHRPPREAGVEVGDPGEAGPMGVHAGLDRGARRRAQGRRVVVREPDAAGGEPVDRRRGDLGPERADVAEPHVVEQDQHHVRASRLRTHGLGPPWCRLAHGAPDVAGELRSGFGHCGARSRPAPTSCSTAIGITGK